MSNLHRGGKAPDEDPSDGPSWNEFIKRTLKLSLSSTGSKVAGAGLVTVILALTTALIRGGAIKIDSWLVFGVVSLLVGCVVGGLTIVQRASVLRAKGPYLILEAAANRLSDSRSQMTENEKAIVLAAMAAGPDQSASELHNLAVLVFGGNASNPTTIDGKRDLIE